MKQFIRIGSKIKLCSSVDKFENAQMTRAYGGWIGVKGVLVEYNSKDTCVVKLLHSNNLLTVYTNCVHRASKKNLPETLEGGSV